MTISAEHDAARLQEKREAVAIIEHALSRIENKGSEPDLWERELLRQAMGWLYRGAYRSAAIAAAHALIPQNERSPEPNIKPDPLLERCDIPTLKIAFEQAATQPITDFPAFGPIMFAGN